MLLTSRDGMRRKIRRDDGANERGALLAVPVYLAPPALLRLSRWQLSKNPMKLCDKDKETSNTRSKQMKSQMSVEAVTTALQVNAPAGNGKTAEHKLPVHGCFSSQSFWKRGSFRSGSNMGSSRSNAGVSGMFPAMPAYGI